MKALDQKFLYQLSLSAFNCSMPSVSASSSNLRAASTGALFSRSVTTLIRTVNLFLTVFCSMRCELIITGEAGSFMILHATAKCSPSPFSSIIISLPLSNDWVLPMPIFGSLGNRPAYHPEKERLPSLSSETVAFCSAPVSSSLGRFSHSSIHTFRS